MISTSITMTSRAEHTPIPSSDVLYWLRNRLRTDVLMVLHIIWHHVEVDTVALQPLSGTTLKHIGKEKSSKRVYILIVHMVTHFVWKGNWPYVWLFTDSWAVENGLSGWLGAWKYHECKILEKIIWEEEYGYNAPNGQRIKVICVPYGCSLKDVFSREGV